LKIEYRRGKPTTIFKFENDSENLHGIKSHHVRTYCGCKCVEMSESGWGTMQLCEIHAERTHLGYGAVIVPQLKVTIPQTVLEGIKCRIRGLLK